MQFKDANGTLLKDGDFILLTGDGVGAFTMRGWRVGVFQHGTVEPLVPPADGSQKVTLPVFQYGTFRVDEATAWAVQNTAEETGRIYRKALAGHRKDRHDLCLHGGK
jgi:hypothetical protein